MNWGKDMKCSVRLGMKSCVCPLVTINLLSKLLKVQQNSNLEAGGITPLHLAICIAGSDDIIDALTSDPQEIGLHSWDSLLHASGQSPYAYAMMRNNHSYNRLVARKLADRRNGQVSLSIENEMEQPWPKVGQEQHFGQGRSSHAKCTVVAAKYSRRMPGSQGLLHRPCIHSMLAIAAVCVCVCLFLHGSFCSPHCLLAVADAS
ncbi:squamosa promoter-binding-like protein 14 [Vitis riparia]|uniref:squamosa promoter-binding-like protein 14 n=1 Tax=Vitis riparia TaxID=96939 RepID=UPI00155A7744|nr:squamosa promoter-binding-like protein 14 [Vitis riparia]